MPPEKEMDKHMSPVISQLSFHSCTWLVNSGTQVYGTHTLMKAVCSS